MDFFDKILNRIDVGTSKLSRASLESNLELEEEEVRRILCEGFLRLAAHFTSGDDLRWFAMEMPSNLVKLLKELGNAMRKRGLKLRASDPIPTYDELIEQIVGKNEDIDEIEERYIQLIAPYIEQLVVAAARKPLNSLVPPKTVRTVVSEMAKALDQYVKEIATIQEELTNAKIEVEKGETEYTAMGESISEEILRRGQEVAGEANKQLDRLAGKELLAVVQARLDLQARYNDVLATKLEEALARIENLNGSQEISPMPAIEDFVKRHGPDARPISEIVKTWNNTRLAKDLADAVVVGGALAADLIQGDGFRDQVPEEVRDAVANLAREPKNWGAYDEARRKIQEVLNNDLITNSKESSKGWISKYKGQLGEDLFNKQFDGANLANNPNQPGYDVFRGPEDGREYIQVKLYSDPNQVLEKMKEVQHRVLNEQILGEDGRVPVRAINWAVPDDKVEEVRRLVAETPELAQITVYPIGITTEQATQLFRSGVDAVGAEGLENFGNLFGELSSGVTSAVVLQSAFVGFLWWKGQREAEEAKSQVVDTVFTSTASFTAALATEEIAGSLIFGGPLGFVLGFTARQIVRRALSSRREFVKHNEAVNKELELLLAKLATC